MFPDLPSDFSIPFVRSHASCQSERDTPVEFPFCIACCEQAKGALELHVEAPAVGERHAWSTDPISTFQSSRARSQGTRAAEICASSTGSQRREGMRIAGCSASFAPPVDNTAATITSGEVAELWYQKQGQHTLRRMIEMDEFDDGVLGGEDHVDDIKERIDDAQIEEILGEWDDKCWIDPALEDAMGGQAKFEQDVEDTLDEISGLVETLASHQRNRNLILFSRAGIE